MQQVLVHQNLLRKIASANLKPSVNKLYIDKLERFPIDLSKLSNVMKK